MIYRQMLAYKLNGCKMSNVFFFFVPSTVLSLYIYCWLFIVFYALTNQFKMMIIIIFFYYIQLEFTITAFATKLSHCCDFCWSLHILFWWRLWYIHRHVIAVGTHGTWSVYLSGLQPVDRVMFCPYFYQCVNRMCTCLCIVYHDDMACIDHVWYIIMIFFLFFSEHRHVKLDGDYPKGKGDPAYRPDMTLIFM